MDSSETLTGERERAPVEWVMDSDIPTQSVDTKCRVGDLHLAFFADKEVVKEHAQRWRSDMREKIDAQTRKDPGVSFVMGGGVPVLSAWVAEECSRVLGQELTEAQERAHAALAPKAKRRDVEAWE